MGEPAYSDAHPGRRAGVRGARPWLLAALTALGFALLDQLSKQAVVNALAPGERVSVFFGIHLTNIHNRGVAFGVLGGGGTRVTVLTLVAVALLVGYFALRAATPLLWLPVGIVVGGAFGNLLDRLREGAVTDFIDVGFWPTFNVADTGIVLGILGVFYVVDAGRTRRRA